MTTTISDGVDTITASVMDGYSATRPTRNVVHAILGSNAPAVSLREAGLRTGTAQLVFELQAVAEDAAAMLASGLQLTLADTDRANVGMTFVLAGDLTVELDSDTRSVWVVSFDFQETD